MFYKIYPLETEPRRAIPEGVEPPAFPKHTPASLARYVRSSFPAMTVHELPGKPYIVVQADLPLPRKDGRRMYAGARYRFGRETHERRRHLGEYAVEAICRNANCRAEPVARRPEMTREEQAQVLRRHGLTGMARDLLSRND